MATHYTAKLVGDRSWEDDGGGVRTGVSRKYQIILDDDPAGTAADEIDPSDVAGLPQPGSTYATGSHLYVSGYSWSGSCGNERRKVFCTVSYSLASNEAGEANKPPRGQDIQSLEWRSGSVSRDLVRDAITGDLLKNTAGQPFDSVPQVDVAAPTWIKVVKTVSRQSGWRTQYNKVNAAAATIGGESFPAKTLRCIQVDEKVLWNDEFGYKYEYTIAIQVMNNSVKVGGAQQAADIGWNLAFISTGTMEKNGEGKLVPVKTIDAETKKEVFVQSPVLLDENGKAIIGEAGGQTAKPFAIEVAAYQTTTFPSDMLSETPTYRNGSNNS